MNDTPLSDVASALGRVPSGLFVVTCRNAAGEETAFLASWVMQAGFDPPALSVAVGTDRAARAFMEPEGSRFAVSVIAESEKGQLGPFAKGIAPAKDALSGVEVERTGSGLAVVPGCLSWMECVTKATTAGSDHVIVVGQVEAARGGREDAPAVHVRRNGLGY